MRHWEIASFSLYRLALQNIESRSAGLLAFDVVGDIRVFSCGFYILG